MSVFQTAFQGAIIQALREMDPNMTIAEILATFTETHQEVRGQALSEDNSDKTETKEKKAKKVKKKRRRSAYLEFMGENRKTFKEEISTFMTTNPTVDPAVVAHFVGNQKIWEDRTDADMSDLPTAEYDGGFTGKLILTLTNRVGTIRWTQIKENPDEFAKWTEKAAAVDAAAAEKAAAEKAAVTETLKVESDAMVTINE